MKDWEAKRPYQKFADEKASILRDAATGEGKRLKSENEDLKKALTELMLAQKERLFKNFSGGTSRCKCLSVKYLPPNPHTHNTKKPAFGLSGGDFFLAKTGPMR